jgi:hypothetical protein
VWFGIGFFSLFGYKTVSESNFNNWKIKSFGCGKIVYLRCLYKTKPPVETGGFSVCKLDKVTGFIIIQKWNLEPSAEVSC